MLAIKNLTADFITPCFSTANKYKQKRSRLLYHDLLNIKLICGCAVMAYRT